ncbi:MAG TPA: pirin family protein, partial [Candidatus Thermoplasmatota archaeon]|nr:pirin family protein [Candidatus Thermoplasmatota archaeon]
MDRTVARVADARRTPEGDGMVVHRAFPGQEVGRIDPFLMLDEMGPIDFAPGARAGFPDHPHRGFETVTYMLEGAFEHRDSHGHAGRLGPGDVQWMTAGAGIVHSEMPHPDLRRDGGRLHGLQLWVNLPGADKMMRPRYQEIPGARIPEASLAGGRQSHGEDGAGQGRRAHGRPAARRHMNPAQARRPFRGLSPWAAMPA